MVKVKICGITNSQDARGAVEAGCDAIGFIFYKRSPRYISPLKARAIIGGLGKKVIIIGVFVNAREKTIRRIARMCSLDIVQFHGRETPAFCRRFKGFKVIKAFRVKEQLDARAVCRYDTFAYLFDTYRDDQFGGTGKRFDWKLIRHIGPLRSPIFLSGGLSVRNVRDAVACVNPAWVDASSALEASAGRKDHRKMRHFVRRAKGGI